MRLTLAIQPPPINPELSIARFVPADARVFVEIPELSNLDATLRRVHAWRAVPMLAGKQFTDAVSPNLGTLVRGIAGIGPSVDTQSLFGFRTGFATNVWRQPNASMFYVVLPDSLLMESWYPKRMRRGEVRAGGTTRFRTMDGAAVLLKDNVLAISDPSQADELFRSTARLMMDRGGKSLSMLPAYEDLNAHLPHRQLARAFVTRKQGVSEVAGAGSLLWPKLQRAAIGLYEQQGRLDLRVFGARQGALEPKPVSSKTLGRMLRLPYSSLLSLATHADFSRLIERAGTNQGGTIARLLTHLAGFGHHASAPSELFGLLGPDVIIVWGQDPIEEGSVPQVALMVQAARGEHIRSEVTHIVEQILKLVAALDPSAQDAQPVIENKTHLGTRISHVSLHEYAGRSKLPAAKLFSHVNPAWAIVDDWLIVAVDAKHIERILDAGHGLIPTISTLTDLQAFRNSKASVELLAFAQVDLAAELLTSWLAENRQGAASLFDRAWWQPRDAAELTQTWQNGIGIEGASRGGGVVVARVLPGTPAVNQLEPGDRILGVNGQFLSIQSPLEDLHRRVTSLPAGAEVELRVQRGDVLRKIVLRCQRENAGFRVANIDPAEAVRELATLGQFLKRATLVVYTARRSEFAAHISLRFLPAKAN